MKPFLRILLPAAVCGLLLGACTQRQTTLKFMSYNIRNGRGIDNVQDLGRVAEIINRTAPDIVALQELDSVTGRMAGRFIPGELGEMTGMHARFCRAIDYDGGAYGVGLLSRDEPLAVRRIPLPGREESRVLFVAEFPDYVVCVTHLSLTPEDQRASLPDHPHGHRHLPQTGAAGRGLQHEGRQNRPRRAGRHIPAPFGHHADDLPVRQALHPHRLHPRPRTARIGRRHRAAGGHLDRRLGPLSAVGVARVEKVAAPCVTQIAGAIRTFPRP